MTYFRNDNASFRVVNKENHKINIESQYKTDTRNVVMIANVMRT